MHQAHPSSSLAHLSQHFESSTDKNEGLAWPEELGILPVSLAFFHSPRYLKRFLASRCLSERSFCCRSSQRESSSKLRCFFRYAGSEGASWHVRLSRSYAAGLVDPNSGLKKQYPGSLADSSVKAVLSIIASSLSSSASCDTVLAPWSASPLAISNSHPRRCRHLRSLFPSRPQPSRLQNTV